METGKTVSKTARGIISIKVGIEEKGIGKLVSKLNGLIKIDNERPKQTMKDFILE